MIESMTFRIGRLVGALVSGALCLTLLVVATSPCFAMWSIGQVSKEQAKALGMEIRSKAAGPNVVWVELEFKPEGKLKDFSHVSLEIGEGEKSLVSASLLEDRSKPGCVAVSFAADRAHLDKIALRVMVADMIPGGTIYELRVKDFVDLGKSPQSNLATDTNTVANAGPSHLSPPASLGKPAKSSSGANTLHPVGGELLPEDSLIADYWQGLDPKSKTVFLTAYRHGLGPSEDRAAKPEFRFLSTDHFATLMAKLDKFYQIPENRHVFLSAAIQIGFMEMSGKAQADIDQAIKQARVAPSRL